MGKCSHCGKQVSMPFSCKFCSNAFCSEHRLPENHDCGGLEAYKESQDNEKVTYDIQKEEKEHKHVKNEDSTVSKTVTNWFNSVKDTINDKRYRNHPRKHQPFTGAIRNSFPEVATFLLLGTIMAAYLLQLAIPTFSELFALNPTIVVTEPWRAVTTIFLHANSGHLLVNAMVLYFFGAELERRIGTSKFLLIFFSSGIAGSVGFTAYALSTGLTTPAVGASGAIYGLFATLAMIAPEIRVLAFFIFPMSIRTALAGFAVLDVFLLTQNTPIASAAHLAGLLTGLYFGYRLKDKFQGRIDLFNRQTI